MEGINSNIGQNEGAGLGNSRSRKVVLQRLEKLGIQPHEKLGQHFLVNDKAIDTLVQNVTPGNIVIEVGAGIGQLTEALAEQASKVIGIEIDPRFTPVLNDITKEHPNVEIVYSDVLIVKLQDYFLRLRKDSDQKVQIIASLPYHISEPFLHKVCNLPFESITLVVGDKLANSMMAKGENSLGFGQLSLLSQTFYHIEVVSWLENRDFLPPPSTKSAIIKLLPKEEFEFSGNQRDFLLRRLFSPSFKMPLVKNVLKEGLVEFKRISNMGTNDKKGFNRKFRRKDRQELNYYLNHEEVGFGKAISKEDQMTLTQNNARVLIQKMNIPESILNKPFQQLNNTEIQILSAALR